MQTESYIWITHQFEGFHNYPNAPDEVSYLRKKHRHIFGLKIWIQVKHIDRDVEFHMFKKFIKEVCIENDFNHRSCEMISNNLHKEISTKYPDRKIKISVDEDGENGSYIKYG